MWGDEEDPYDYHCGHCGAGYHFEVGFGVIICHHCGQHISGEDPAKSAPIVEHPDSDVTCDSRYVIFDDIKAFRFLRDHDLLDEFLEESNDFDINEDIDVEYYDIFGNKKDYPY